MNKKYLFGAFLAASSLVGCQNEAPQQTAAESQGTADYVSPLPDDAPVVTVVTNSVQPPFVFLDGNGNLRGMDVDIIRAIGEKEGFKVELHDEPFGNILPSIESGKYQIAMSALSYTPERASKYAHTNPYLYNPSVVLYRSDLNLNNTQELVNLRVGVLPDTKQYDFLTQLGVKSLDTAKTEFSLVQNSLQGKYDAVLADRVFLDYVLSNYDEHRSQFKYLEYEDTNEPSSQIVFYVNKNNQELVDKLNQGIEKLQAEGKIEQIKNSYLQANAQ